MAASDRLTVAVTGPTGDLGIALVSALERSRRVERIVGMARRPFDPSDHGWRKTEYGRGDVRDRDSVREVVKGADVVVHLAFSILGSGAATRAINVEGSRNVFEAATKAGAERICHASSIAAYGFHDENPTWIEEDVPARGTREHFYSQQKAEVEQVLSEVLERRRKTKAYVFRPCIVAGPTAQMPLADFMPYIRLSESMPEPVVRLLSSVPVLRPVVPDPGVSFQLIHEDDVASAFVAGALGRGAPGAYNLAGKGTITIGDVARSARLVLDTRPGRGRRDGGRGGVSHPRRARVGILDPGGAKAPSRAHHPRPEGARLAPPAHHTAGDARAGGRLPSRAARSLSRLAARRYAASRRSARPASSSIWR